jgi:hypothetical protein
MSEFPITILDESYNHQNVAPSVATAHVHPAWAERTWFLVDLGEGWVLGAGRAVWPHGGKRTAKAGLNTGGFQFARRTADTFAIGDDPDRPDTGSIRIEVVEPMRAIRLVLDEPGLPWGFDLTFRPRFIAVPTARNTIEVRGEIVTDYMNFFQSGTYTGTVHADGEERRYDGRLGFRDRGWGLRKHEGASKRGMHIFCGAEMPSESLYMLIYENARGERMFTNGWLIDESGLRDTAVAAEHDLRFDGRKLLDGRLSVELSRGGTRELTVEAEGRVWMESVGYTSVPGRADPGADRLDLADPEIAAAWDGFYDNGCRFDAGGVQGHGFVEVGLGIHAKYLPESGP